MQQDIELFGDTDNITFLSEIMSLDLEYIQIKIESIDSEYKDYFLAIFNFMVNRYNYFRNSYDTVDLIHSPRVTQELNQEFLSIGTLHGIQEDSDAYKIGDVLRHFFIHFSEGGLRQAHKHREAEYWYPRIIFRERIESDISDLDNRVTIYRGASQEEHTMKAFGQSWTLDKKVAHKFAFSEYSHSEDYVGTMRVVLKAKIDRDNVLLYERNEQHNEKEVVVQSDKLEEIELLEERLLKA